MSTEVRILRGVPILRTPPSGTNLGIFVHLEPVGSKAVPVADE